MELVLPNKSHQDAWTKMVSEFKRVDGKVLPAALENGTDNFDEWLRIVRNYEQGINLRYHHVPATFYFLLDDNKNVVGCVDIRHFLNKILESSGGHIGFGITPLERNKGYGTQALILAKKKCDDLEIKCPLVVLKDQYEYAERAIIKAGGKFLGVLDDNGKIKRRYML